MCISRNTEPVPLIQAVTGYRRSTIDSQIRGTYMFPDAVSGSISSGLVGVCSFV